MAYREPDPPKPSEEEAQATAEADAQTEVLLAELRKRRRRFALLATTIFLVAFGLFVGPIAYEIARDAWHEREVTLEPGELSYVAGALGPIEDGAKASKAAIAKEWPALRDGMLGPSSEKCPLIVPGPILRTRHYQQVLDDVNLAAQWSYVDAIQGSLLSTLRVPDGPIDVTTVGGDTARLTLGQDRLLRVVTIQIAPMLDSTRDGEEAHRLREQAAPAFRHDFHGDFLAGVRLLAEDAMKPDVIVFVDRWKSGLPFEASARAYAWDPMKQKVACAVDAVVTGLTPREIIHALESSIETAWTAAAPRAK